MTLGCTPHIFRSSTSRAMYSSYRAEARRQRRMDAKTEKKIALVAPVRAYLNHVSLEQGDVHSG